MKELIIANLLSFGIPFIAGVAIPALIAMYFRAVPRSKLYLKCFWFSRKYAEKAKIKLGKKGWESARDGVITTIYDIADGLRDGLRTTEKPEPTPPND